jgi:hypothetical protein
MIKKSIFFFSFIFIFTNSVLFSQVTGGSTIVPGKLAWKVGLIAGPSFGFLMGDYPYPCDYLFSGGDGTGFFINAVATYPIDYYSDIYFSLGYQYNPFQLSQNKNRLKQIYNELEPVNVLMRGDMDLSLHYLNLDCNYKRKLWKNLYGFGGIGLFLNLKTKLKITETIIDDRFVFYSTGHTSDPIYEEGELPNASSLLFSGRLGLGYDFYFGNKYILAPQVGLIYPFSNLITTDDWKLMNLNIGLQFLYIF